MRRLGNKSTRNFGRNSFRRHFDGALPGIIFIASAILYVGGSIAMFLSNTPTVA